MKLSFRVIGVFLICFMGNISCCPRNWALFKSQCYYFSTNTTSWVEAEGFCRSLHSTLGTLDDADKVSAVRFVLNADAMFRDRTFWIGASDLANEGQWRWFSSGDLIPLDSPVWSQTQPGGGDSENCLAIQQDGDSAYFHDFSCAESDLNFICEKQNGGQTHGGAIIIG